MEGLRFTPQGPGAADPDMPIISDEELERAGEEGKSRGSGMSEGAATLIT